MNIFIGNEGCTRRKLDVSRFQSYFQANGYKIVSRPQQADYLFITTCAFKKEEEDRSLRFLETMKNLPAKLIVYGCLPEVAPSRFNTVGPITYLSPKNIDAIDNLFPGIEHKFSEIGDANLITDRVLLSPLSQAAEKFIADFELSSRFLSRSIRYATRSIKKGKKPYYLFACRGCLGNCSYCAVRFAVGTIKSKLISHLLEEFGRSVEAGYCDYILLGDDVGAYGQDIGSSFTQLVGGLLAKLDETQATDTVTARQLSQVRIHLEDINPRWLILYRDEFLEQAASGRLASLLCPVQSGNDRILQLMNRKHDAAGIFAMFADLKRTAPRLRINSQIIVGFPTETESEFDETLSRLAESPCDSVMIFPYSDKENTAASRLEDKVPGEVIERRVAQAQAFLKKQRITAVLSCQDQ